MKTIQIMSFGVVLAGASLLLISTSYRPLDAQVSVPLMTRAYSPSHRIPVNPASNTARWANTSKPAPITENSLSAQVGAPKTHPLGDRIRLAIGNGDLETSVLDQLRAELRRNTPEVGREMLEAMQLETDPTVLIVLANLLGENPDVMMSDEAIRALTALTDSELAPKRQAALAALSYANMVTPQLVERVTLLSREDGSNAVRVSAIASMSVWMGRKPSLVERLSQELLATAHSADDPVVRGNAIQLIANQGQKLDDNVLQEFGKYLDSETVPENRQLAAYGLGSATGTARPAALAQLQLAYGRELDIDTRRVILMQIVRAGAEGAAAILQTLPADQTLLQNDVRDYLDILALGIRNADEIWTRKSLRDADRGTEIGMVHNQQEALN